MSDKLQTAVRDNGTVYATFEDSNGMHATVSVSREDLAKLIRCMEGNELRSRPSTFMEPDTALVQAAGAYLKRTHGYQIGAIINMENWSRIWLAESLGWNRATVEAVTF